MLFYGLFEQHLGAYALLGSAAPESAWQIAAAGSAAPHADVWSLAAVSAVLGWSGFVHACASKSRCIGNRSQVFSVRARQIVARSRVSRMPAARLPAAGTADAIAAG